jgi:hypothetical protein
MWAVEPFPLVPAIWMLLKALCGFLSRERIRNIRERLKLAEVYPGRTIVS